MSLIIGLDFGKNLGIATGKGRRPQCETLTLPSDPGAMALRLEGRIRSYMRENQVALIAYEDPFIALGGKWRRTGQSELKQHLTTQFGQKLLILKLAHENDIPTMAIAANNARKIVVGKGYPTEQEIMDAAHAAGADAGNNHEADAALIYLAALQKRYK